MRLALAKKRKNEITQQTTSKLTEKSLEQNPTKLNPSKVTLIKRTLVNKVIECKTTTTTNFNPSSYTSSPSFHQSPPVSVH